MSHRKAGNAPYSEIFFVFEVPKALAALMVYLSSIL